MGNILKQFSPTVHDAIGVTSGIVDQAKSSESIYELVQPPSKQGRGTLVEEAAQCFQTKDYAPLHEKIRNELKSYLYNDGNGEHIAFKVLVEKRNKERKAKTIKKKEEQALTTNLFQRDSHLSESFTYAGSVQDNNQTRLCCWDVNKRGALGETALHVCLLNNSDIHTFLAQEMINVFPCLLYDIYLGDEYYGENILHMAIANENTNLIKFILSKGKEIDLNVILKERCCGNFFCPADQVSGRMDVANSEIVKAPRSTNYKGLVYWGEYPLSFAACSNQPSAYLMLLKNKADVLAKDNNGNNVLHLMVIHNNQSERNFSNLSSHPIADSKISLPRLLLAWDTEKDMFDLCYNHAGDKQTDLLAATNNQGLTPVTLAAKLANKAMLDHILEMKREIAWQFGDVTCAHYPLSDIDTISHEDGSINNNSALSIILNAQTAEHLSMLDGLLYQLLHEKWKQYAKVKFYESAALFFLYLGLFVASVYLQPPQPRTILTVNSENLTVLVDDCYLQAATDAQQIARFVCEALTLLGALIYLLFACLEVKREGIATSLHTIANAPMKASFHISCVLVVAILPCRFSCSVVAENVFLTLAIFTGIPYLLFFCRGFKLVGPFIVAIYKMIKGDLLRFLLIYVIFLLGFSQAMYLLFRGVDHPLFSYPHLSVLGMFIITLGEFGDLYADFDQIRNPDAAKFLFAVYMIIVTVLLINVLIAMMGNTFNEIAETRWEWQRQWAKIVLVMEQTVPAENRKRKQRRYSQLGNDKEGSRWFVVRNFREKKS